MKKAEAGKGDLFTGKAKQLNEVAEDANWRIAVNTELKSADQWNEDWGFLVAHQNGGKSITNLFSPSFCALIITVIDPLSSKAPTKDDVIRKLEEEVMRSKAKSMSKTSDAYGNGQTLEMFSMAHLNRTKNPDLMPCPRRPPKKKAAE